MSSSAQSNVLAYSRCGEHALGIVPDGSELHRERLQHFCGFETQESELDSLQFWLLQNVLQCPEMSFACVYPEDLPKML